MAVRPFGVFGLRLLRSRLDGDERMSRRQGSALVTGAVTGAVAHTLRRMVDNGAEHLVIAMPPGTAGRDTDTYHADVTALEAELTALGARVDVVDCDPADREALAELLRDIPADRPLMVLQSTDRPAETGPLAALDSARIVDGLGPVTAAALNLHELTQERDVAAFVLFGTFHGALGTPEHAERAAIDAFLQALAEYRQARGLTAVSVAWGPWESDGGDSGEAYRTADIDAGLRCLDPQRAAMLLPRLVDRDRGAALAVADVEWGRLVAQVNAASSALLADLPDAQPHLDRGHDSGRAEWLMNAQDAAAELRRQLAGLSVEEQENVLLDTVCRYAARVLGLASAGEIDSELTFLEIGFSSVTGLELRNLLRAGIGLDLPTALIFEYPTPRSLVRHLADEFEAQQVCGDIDPAH